jgi:hypothetical protein
MSHQLSQETLAQLKTAQGTAFVPEGDLAKSFMQSATATAGLTAYDLEGPAKTLYPVLTPLRNEIPRVSGAGGIQANWKAVTKINLNRAGIGIAEGKRGMVIQTEVKDYYAAYKGIGLDDNVTFEAQYAGETFEDVKARCALGLLQSLMIGEEACILGGNGGNGVDLTQPGTPTVVASGSGGTLATATLSVICIPLNLEAYLASTVTSGLPVSGNRTVADGSVQFYNAGTGAKSSAGTASVTGPTGSATASVAGTMGAVAYAWFWGTSGNEVLGAITTINSVKITANAAGTQNASVFTANWSKNGFLFDGLLSIAMNSNYGSYVVNMPTGTAGTGTPLTPDNKGGIVEIDDVLKYLWDNYRLSPTCIWVGAQEASGITKAVLTTTNGSGSAPAFRFNIDVQQGLIAGSMNVSSYLNKFTMTGVKDIPIKIHPNMPNGTILFDTATLPYQMSNVTNVRQIKTRQEYYQMEWPLRTRQYEFGVYADEVLQHYFPPAMAVIRNIAPST